MARRLESSDWDVAVLSSELFERSRPQAVQDAIATYLPKYADRLTVVCYIRPHASRAVSNYAENIKLGYSGTSFASFVEAFIAAGHLTYAPRLANWRGVFGKQFVVRPYLRADFINGDIRHDFLTTILGAGKYELRDSGHDSNAALTMPDLALMRFLQQELARTDGVPKEHRVAFGKQFGRLLRDLPESCDREKLRLPHALYQMIVQNCAEDAAALDTEWFDRPCLGPELIRAEAETIKEAQSIDAKDYFDTNTLRLMRAWAQLMSRQIGDEDFPKRLRPPE